MSFRCSDCKKPHPGRPTRVITAARPRRYPNGIDLSLGWEIAQEKSLCSPCAAVRLPVVVDLNDPAVLNGSHTFSVAN